MISIKIILIIFLLVILRAFLVQESLVLTKRVVAFSMFLVLVLLVMFPKISTCVANAVGIGRGVDLVFYFSHLFLLFLIVGLWRRSVVLMATITKLSRAIAVQSARKPQVGKEQKTEGKDPT
jgi:hypothetical protein